MSLTEICLYKSDFQRKLRKLGKEQQTHLDLMIKDYIGKIRQIRDCMYRKGELPEQAKVEISTYKPML